MAVKSEMKCELAFPRERRKQISGKPKRRDFFNPRQCASAAAHASLKLLKNVRISQGLDFNEIKWEGETGNGSSEALGRVSGAVCSHFVLNKEISSFW